MDGDPRTGAAFHWLDDQEREGVWQAEVIKEMLTGKPGALLNEKIDKIKEIPFTPEAKAAVFDVVVEAITWRGMALRVEAALHRQLKDHEAAMKKMRKDYSPKEF